MRIGIDARQLAGPVVGTRKILAEVLEEWRHTGVLEKHQVFLYCPQALPSEDFPGFHLRLGRGVNKIIGGTIWLEGVLPRQAQKDALDVFWAPTDILPLPLAASVPCLLSVMDVGCYKIPKQLNLYIRLIYGLFFKRSLQAARAIACIAESTKNDLVELGIAPEKIGVVYPGARAPGSADAAAQADALIRRRGISPPYFLFVGHLRPNKNLERMLSAFKIFIERSDGAVEAGGRASRGSLGNALACGGAAATTLVMIGGRTKTDGGVMKLLGDGVLKERVRYLGYVSEAELAAFYQRALAFISPSLYEGFGLPYLEAMAAGVPVIAPNIPTVSEVCGGAAFYVNPSDVLGIAEGFSQLSRNPRLRNDLMEKGRRRAASFTWAETARRIMKLLEEIRLRGRQ